MGPGADVPWSCIIAPLTTVAQRLRGAGTPILFSSLKRSACVYLCSALLLEVIMRAGVGRLEEGGWGVRGTEQGPGDMGWATDSN